MTVHTPRLSIVLPTYNRALLLGQALESLREAAPEDSEIIIVDNASTDSTGDVVSNHGRVDTRVRLIVNERNLGPVVNYNRALYAAQAPYVCMFGDDDLAMSGCFDKKLAILDAFPDIGLVYSRWYEIDELGNNRGIADWAGLTDYSYLGGRQEFVDLFMASYIMMQTVVFRRELRDQFGGLDESPEIVMGHDWDLWLRYCTHTETAFLNEPTAKIRVHEGSTTSQEGIKQGHFAAGKLAIWRKWLMNDEEPLVFEERNWHVMQEAYAADLNNWFRDNRAMAEDYLNQFHVLLQDYNDVILRRSEALKASVALAVS